VSGSVSPEDRRIYNGQQAHCRDEHIFVVSFVVKKEITPRSKEQKKMRVGGRKPGDKSVFRLCRPAEVIILNS